MKKTFTILAAALSIAGLQIAQAGEFCYGGNYGPCTSEDNGCCFSYDYIDVTYMYSDYKEDADPAVLAGLVTTAPNGSIINEMKGVDVEFKKSLGCSFYLAGEFYNTDGFLDPQVVNAAVAAGNNSLINKRAELYYYRLGVGGRHSVTDRFDVTFEVGGIYYDCEVPTKDQDEWAWYFSPGARFCLGDFGEVYANYFYENYETTENHRFDGGVVVPLPCSDNMSFKFGGRYETLHEKCTWLAGIRFDY